MINPDKSPIDTHYLCSSNCIRVVAYYANLQVSCPANTQPAFPAGTTLEGMFFRDILNAPLIGISRTLCVGGQDVLWHPLLEPIHPIPKYDLAFAMFADAVSFSQPFSFNCSGMTDMRMMFYNARKFNSPLALLSTLQAPQRRKALLVSRQPALPPEHLLKPPQTPLQMPLHSSLSASPSRVPTDFPTFSPSPIPSKREESGERRVERASESE